jgi:3-phosphoshikimate 1-carboxyvinyltransferase
MSDADSIVVQPSGGVRGSLHVAGDKSISHRAAMLSSLSSGVSMIRGFLASEDCLDTLKAVESLGAAVERTDDGVAITGTNGRFIKPNAALDLGNSGTGMRLLSGLLAGQEFVSEMTGDASLRSRPMDRIKKPLEMMGADVELLGDNGCAPVRVTGSTLKGIEYHSPVASAQIKSCVLLAGLYAKGRTTVIEPAKSRDHTELMLKTLGVDVVTDGLSVSLEGTAGAPLSFAPVDWYVPGDFSSAAFWITAAACREGCELTVEGVGLNPRRTALLDILRRMGADIEVIETSGSWEPFGNIVVKGGSLHATEVGGDEIPNVLDELPLVAVAGVLSKGQMVIRDAAELRVKETDRIAAVTAGLSALGAKVEEKPDGMVIDGNGTVAGGADVDSEGDHRIAMAMAILALHAEEPVTVRNTACIATSYPEFGNDLEKLTT